MPVTRHRILFVALFTCSALGCSTFSGKSFLPTMMGYNESNRKVFVLKKKLLEISGIAHLEKDIVATINDEQGELFIVNLQNDSIQTYRFKGKDDYEELVKTDSLYYVLESDGDVLEVTIPPDVKATTYKFQNEYKIEFESMVWYKKEKKLVLISKDKRGKKAGITAFTFDLTTKKFDPEPFFEISLKQVLIKLQDYSGDCKPSAAALHPITNKLFIIASIGKLLLQCSAEGKLEKVYKLNPAQLPQPEGITFAVNGDMYISNEGLQGKATVLKFPYSGGK